ncbi:MAG: Holliday junction endonuclease [Pseudomonadota bacterium]|nr:Holliday junction endonuclease [Pseudomonadota bacterium]
MIVGIDPGQKGGVAFIAPTGRTEGRPMPLAGKEIDGHALSRMLFELTPSLVIIEKVHSMPKQGVASTFKFGMGYGIVIGVCEALGLPYRLVTPQAWKKAVLSGTAKDKSAAINFVRRAYPGLNLSPGRLRAPHDGIADAVCLAEYGRQLMAKEAS